MLPFRFESLLNLRRRQRDDLSRELVQTRETIARVDEQIELLQQQRDQLRNAVAKRFDSETAIDISVDRIRNEARYDEHLADDQTKLRSTRDQFEVELERRRALLVEAEAEVKRLERLRDKQAAEHHRLQLQREQVAADELTSARMMMSRR